MKFLSFYMLEGNEQVMRKKIIQGNETKDYVPILKESGLIPSQSLIVNNWININCVPGPVVINESLIFDYRVFEKINK